MRHDTRPDLTPVYHEPEAPDQADDTSGQPKARVPDMLTRKFWLDEPPRFFALVDDVADDTATSLKPDDDAFDPDDGVAWGIEFPHEAVVYLRNPYTGGRTFGTHQSAERAHEFYQRWGKLRLVYLPA